ncbi:hypothetical protein [Mobiluncus curtisii]|uniref:hypothetical protein n=1 Tax=Mobiluncus curtisii TaxID=2051 RepID=UPI00242F9CB3|nr:hypothetical protein [Mobiluncus curtisii]
MITEELETEGTEYPAEPDTTTGLEPTVEPVDDCGCSKHGETSRVRMRHPNLTQTIEVNPASVPNWEKTGWETIK